MITTYSVNNLGMATDLAGNFYLLCQFREPDSPNNQFGVLEFGPQADNGDPPIRTLTSSAMYPWSGGPGIAVDSDEVIYITAGPPIGGTQTIFEFAANASGNAAPANILTSPEVWMDTLSSKIAVH